MDDARANYRFLTPRSTHLQSDWSIALERVETGDLDGDGLDEIVVGGQILDDLNHLDAKGMLNPMTTIAPPPQFGAAFSVDDVDGDAKDDVVVLYAKPNEPGLNAGIDAWGYNSAGAFTRIHSIAYQNDTTYPTITTANVDDDSAVVMFQGHERLFTEPRLVAVLAAPPSYEDLEMDDAQAGTTFGQGADETRSLGFTVGYSVHTEIAGGLFAQPADAFQRTLEQAFDGLTAARKSAVYFYHHRGTAASDTVAFTAIPFDVYSYRVLSSPVAAEIGTTMVINVPREPQPVYVDRQSYNEKNGSFLDVGETILGHTIGDPRSYPARTSVGADFTSSEVTVALGPGSSTATIGEGAGAAYELVVDVPADVDVDAGAYAPRTAEGFHLGFSYAITSMASTYYEGSVANLLGSAAAADQFEFGLYVKLMTVAGQQFPVVGYWVD